MTPGRGDTPWSERRPLASIVIPTYDRAWGLAPALESALAQTYAPLEVVVVDDGSRDETPTVVGSFHDERLRAFRRPENRGVVANWGWGLELAQGELVAILADDDQLEPTFVARRVAALARHERASVAFSPFEKRTPDGRRIALHGGDWRTARELAPAEMLEAALSRRWFIGASLYRTEVVRSLWPHVQPDDLVLDYSLNLHLALEGGSTAAFTPEADFIMGVHPGQSSVARREAVLQQASALLRRLLQRRPLEAAAGRAIRRELARWMTIHGRLLAGEGRQLAGIQRLARALAFSPMCGPAWRALLLTLAGRPPALAED